jgi:hypothetical protein
MQGDARPFQTQPPTPSSLHAPPRPPCPSEKTPGIVEYPVFFNGQAIAIAHELANALNGLLCGRAGLHKSAKGLRGLSLGVRRFKVFNLQQVKILPGIWVAPAGSDRNDGGGNETVEAFETNVSLQAMQRTDRP